MEEQKEALQRIVNAVQSKYLEAQEFAADLENDIRSLSEHHSNALSDLNAQFQALSESLEIAKSRMTNEIKDVLKSKQLVLENQLKTFVEAEEDTEDLLQVAKNALLIDDHLSFAQAALNIKNRVTMAPIFRLSLSALNVETECHLLADFEREQQILNRLNFLPVPETPIIVDNGCHAEDNIVHCSWKMPGEEMVACDNEEYGLLSTTVDCASLCMPVSVEHYMLQYRQVEKNENLLNKPWITVENIPSSHYSIQGLKFDQEHVQIRVQAWNKSLGGSFSATHLISTPAFNFSFDPEACHANLTVASDKIVEWDTNSNKAPDARIRSAGVTRSSSPALKAVSPRKSKTKDRFTGESYTILGDKSIPDKSECYYEVTPHPECKTYTIGVSSANIGRFDQIGKNNFSWGIHVSTWMQNTYVAKHNNKVKNLEGNGTPPSRYGVYINTEVGALSFYDPEKQQCIHTFKLVKKNGPLLPGFLLWFGSIEIHTGLQVPSWVVKRPVTSQSQRSAVVSPQISPDQENQKEAEKL